MPRGLTTVQKAAIANRVKALSHFVYVGLDTPVRVWTGRGPIVTLGGTWTGIGELGVINGVGGERGLRTQDVSISLVGLPGDLLTPGIISATRATRYQGRPMQVFLGIHDPETFALIDDPVELWGGFANVLSFQLGQEATVTLTGQHYESHLRRSNGWNMSTVSHNQRFGLPPNTDLFFEPNDRLMGVARPILG